MEKEHFYTKVKELFAKQEKLLSRKNEKQDIGNGIYDKYVYPVLSSHHVPIYWRYDLDYKTNPHLMERMMINVAFNSGAIEFNGKICLVARVEGADRKSFFSVAESLNGIDNFRFWDYPLILPETDLPETNVYDMRLTKHEDGWIYGLFCVERHDDAKPDDPSAAVASCGIARTKDLDKWERLPDLKTNALQQRNCVLHPEFVNGKYAFYTRPLASFASLGSGTGIGYGLSDKIVGADIKEETIFDGNIYHTIKEGKNGQGPAPIKTSKGWLHLAHGVRGTAAGMRYVLYCFMTELNNPSKIIYEPGGHFIAPRGEERVGDVSNVVFSNGWIAKGNDVFIYYGSSDTRMHVATTTIDKLLDYCMNTPKDGLRSPVVVSQRVELIKKNLEIMKSEGIK